MGLFHNTFFQHHAQPAFNKKGQMTVKKMTVHKLTAQESGTFVLLKNTLAPFQTNMAVNGRRIAMDAMTTAPSLRMPQCTGIPLLSSKLWTSRCLFLQVRGTNALFKKSERCVLEESA